MKRNLTNHLSTKAELCIMISNLTEIALSLHDDESYTRDDAIDSLLGVIKSIERLAYEDMNYREA